MTTCEANFGVSGGKLASRLLILSFNVRRFPNLRVTWVCAGGRSCDVPCFKTSVVGFASSTWYLTQASPVAASSFITNGCPGCASRVLEDWSPGVLGVVAAVGWGA